MAGLNLPSLMIKILADGSHAIEEIHSVKDAAMELTNVGANMTKFTTAPIVAALTAAVKSAGDFNETLGKTEVVFGSMTDAVLKWSENSVEAMGLAQSTALEMASAYGDMATGMGLGTAEAAQMSMNITQLAADIASFKNKSIKDVNTSMLGIFTGETESLKQLGIVMTQTNLEAYALSQGITKSVSAMSQAEQVQLRYSYVMAQSANAQGDFVRTGDSLNNQTRKLVETLKQLANEFGGPLTEKVAGVVGKLQSAAQWLSELDDGTKKTILNIGMLVAAAGPLMMVAGKLLGMLTTIKTTFLSFTANPITMGVTAVLAALSAIAAISNKTVEGLDKTSDTYKNLKNAVEGGAEGKISIDDTQVKELEANPPKITISADGQNALDEAQKIANQLNSGDYDGELAIDGDPAKADAALAELEAAIEAAEAAITIDADGNAILEEGGELERLQNAIAGVEGIIPITTDPVKKATLQSYLDNLKAQLNALNGSVEIKESEDTDANIQAFKDKLDTLPKDETYSVTGEFKVSDTTTETIQEYANALAAAATATDDYAAAVDNLNNIVDQEAQRKIAEINEQIVEEAQYQASLLSAGMISDEQAQANIEKALVDGKKKIEQIEAEAEAQKKLNDTYANGLETDDAPSAASAFLDMFRGAELSQEQENASAQSLYDAYADDTIGDNQSKIDAQIQLNALKKEAQADQEALTAATEKYNAAISKADTNEQASVKSAQEQIERSKVLQDALENYKSRLVGGLDNPISATLDTMKEELSAYEGLYEEFASILQGEDGNGLAASEVLNVSGELENMQAASEEKLTAAKEEAEAARSEALSEYQSTIDSINEGYSASETEGILSLVEQAGITVSDMDKQMITGGKQAIADLATALQDSSGDVQAAIDAAYAQMDTSGIGNDAAAGVGQGEREYDFSSDSEAMVANNESAIRAAANSHSPAQRFKPVGGDIAAGVGEGMQGYDFSGNASAMISAIMQAVNAAIGQSGQQIGRQLTSGVAQGIKNGTSAAEAAAIASAKRVTAAYKNALDIHSPSRVARDEIGLQFARGVGAGIEKGMPEVMRIIRASTDGIVSSATSVVNKGAYTVPISAAASSNMTVFDYDKLADAVSKRPIAFSVGTKQMAAATRDEAARQQAIRVQQINRSYGNGG